MLLSADTSALLLSCLCFVFGLLGSFTIIPGNLIVWLGILSHRLWLGEASSVGYSSARQDCDAHSPPWAACLDYWVRNAGASKNGLIGAIIGASLAFLFTLMTYIRSITGSDCGQLTAEKSGIR